MDGFGGSGDWVFTGAPDFIGIMFVIFFIVIIVQLFIGLSQWKKNEESPRLAVPAIVKSKRTKVTRNVHTNDQNVSSQVPLRPILVHLNLRVEIGSNSVFQAGSLVFLQKGIAAL
ncbi:DUF2500 family protein [Peribacillus simplex]|uniref:DUF2500 family protein n=1 Tax=Peribacillus simplex TaxID=1478 RepID=UPI00399C9BAB